MLKNVLVAAALAFAAPSFAAATLLTSDVGYTGRGLDLTAYATGSYNFTFGPAPVDGLIFTVVSNTTNSGQGGVLGQGSYALNDNGSFGGNAVYAAVDAPTGYFQLLGDNGYDEFGLFVNYAVNGGQPYSPVLISSLDVNGNVIDSFDISALAPVSTPGGFNEFRFRGISYDDGTQVYGLRFEGSYILATGTADGVPPIGGVPEAATWAMLIAGFGMVGSALRRRRALEA